MTKAARHRPVAGSFSWHMPIVSLAFGATPPGATIRTTSAAGAHSARSCTPFLAPAAASDRHRRRPIARSAVVLLLLDIVLSWMGMGCSSDATVLLAKVKRGRLRRIVLLGGMGTRQNTRHSK